MAEKIRFQIDISKILEVLSSKIYDSPYALLRENVQNANDAVLMRSHRLPGTFSPRIEVTVTTSFVEVRDNGIGMTPEDFRNHFWRAGASGKNTPEAREAGVVGTFGIGGLANFGICKKLIVTSESAETRIRTRCQADRDTLSLEEKSILIDNLPSLSEPGTTIKAELPSDRVIDVGGAIGYLKTFVQHVPNPIIINGVLSSMRPLEESCPQDGGGWSTEIKDCKADSLRCDLKFRISESGVVWIEMGRIVLNGNPIEGSVLLKQGLGQIMTYKNGFGLARAGVYSNYSFGGVANLKVLQPTAGRDALTSESIQTLQSIVSSSEQMIAPIISDSPYVDMNTSFMSWAAQRGRFDLVRNLKVVLLPSGRVTTLKEVADLSQKIHLNYYRGTDESVAQAFTSEETPLVRIARSNPRGQCEEGFLARYGKLRVVSGQPQVLRVKSQATWTKEEAAFAFKLGQVLVADYFVPVKVQLGQISPSLPILVKGDVKPMILTLDPANATVKMLLQCYNSDFTAFGSFVKDFIRTVVFPRIASLVPSSTREGAEAFLKILRRQRDTFEYDITEMRQLDDVIAGFTKGTVSFTEVVDRALAAARKQEQTVTVRDISPVTSVVPDVVVNQQALEKTEMEVLTYSSFAPKPPIIRSDVETNAKMLVLDDTEIVYNYKGLLRLSERAYIERAEFFFQPHFTEVIWGGQRIIFIFRHASGAFGFYYDIQLNELLSIPSGGSSFETMTIILKNSVFLPIPSNLFQYFTPSENQKKRFDVRYDILYPE